MTQRGGRTDRQTDGWMDGRTDGRTDGRMDGRIDGRTDRNSGVFSCVHMNKQGRLQVHKLFAFLSFVAIHFQDNSIIRETGWLGGGRKGTIYSFKVKVRLCPSALLSVRPSFLARFN